MSNISKISHSFISTKHVSFSTVHFHLHFFHCLPYFQLYISFFIIFDKVANKSFLTIVFVIVCLYVYKSLLKPLHIQHRQSECEKIHFWVYQLRQKSSFSKRLNDIGTTSLLQLKYIACTYLNKYFMVITQKKQQRFIRFLLSISLIFAIVFISFATFVFCIVVKTQKYVHECLFFLIYYFDFLWNFLSLVCLSFRFVINVLLKQKSSKSLEMSLCIR